MEARRLAGALGAEITGVDLTVPLDGDRRRRLQALLLEHQVIFFRDQDLGPAALRDLARTFGPLQTHPAYGTVEGMPEVMVLESTADRPSKIEVWHSDMTFRQHPPTATVLRSVVVPPVGGDTLFASMTAAFRGLSSGMQRYLEDLVAVHDFRQGFRESLAEPGGAERLADALRDYPPVRHPVVQRHPETDEPVLFVNGLFTTHIEDLPPLESDAVLRFLVRHAVSPEYTCRFHWRPHSVAIWDNRSTQHKPVNDFFPATRRLHRVVSEGDRPY